MKNVLLLFTLLLALATQAQELNTLTKKEQRQGWKLLFDGKTLNGWRNYNKADIKPQWVVEDGCIKLTGKGGGDIITSEEFENYELNLDWKISKNGNSGIIFNVLEDPKIPTPWMSGPEMQVLDNEGHPDAKIEKHRAGDLYDLIKSSSEPVKPFGEWNSIRLISNKGLLTFYLNGTKVVETRTDDQAWLDTIAKSKFKAMPHFGRYQKGHLCIQDHGDVVWYKNIKIKSL